MEIRSASGDISAQEVGAVVVNLFSGAVSPGGSAGAVDRAAGGVISQLISAGEITGEQDEVTVIHTMGDMYRDFAPARVVVVGLGDIDNLSLDAIRSASAAVARRLRAIGVGEAATVVHGAGAGGMEPGACAEAIAEGTMLGLYRFDKYRASSRERGRSGGLSGLTLVEQDDSRLPAIESGLARGRVFAQAAMTARDMVNEPANHLTPARMAETARQVGSGDNLTVEVLEGSDCESLGMGAFLGVAQGSHQPPKFIRISYEGAPEDPANNIWLIGKSITFDTGGISIKPAANMGAMKGDMSGGAAVIGAMEAISELQPRLNVHAVCAATENMPGGGAQRPGDVVQAMNGKHIEIDNTDAEGRLTLADAVSYARSNGAARIVDIATLTGAINVALGSGQSGLFSNNDELAQAVTKAAATRGEPVWRLPMDKASRKQNESKIADIKNSGGRPAGSITAAHFIAEFVEDTPWAHLDIAATNMRDSDHGWETAGATGVPARALVQLVLDLAS
ncbi:MAG: leucyl aminopeptidase [Chloroflexota bacterium]